MILCDFVAFLPLFCMFYYSGIDLDRRGWANGFDNNVRDPLLAYQIITTRSLITFFISFFSYKRLIKLITRTWPRDKTKIQLFHTFSIGNWSIITYKATRWSISHQSSKKLLLSKIVFIHQEILIKKNFKIRDTTRLKHGLVDSRNNCRF